MKRHLLTTLLILGVAFNHSLLIADTSITGEGEKDVVLYQNYPNPCESYTVIKYHVPVGSLVNIRIYDILGKVISYPVKNVVSTFSENSITVDTRNLLNGIYFYELRVNNELAMIKKMAVVK